MELTAIYHRPESEYAYLIRTARSIRIRHPDQERVMSNGLFCIMGPLFFIEDLYEATMKWTR